MILEKFGQPDVIWASPDCTSYSIAAISHHRAKEEDGNLAPKSDYAKFCDKVNQHMLWLIEELKPKYYFIENPRGGMRKMNFMRGLPRYTITYCQYNNPRVERVIWGMQEKKCPKCGEIKLIDQFYKNVTRRDGLTSWCKECSNESHKNYVKDNSEHMKEYGRKRYWENPEHHRKIRRKSNVTNAESIKEARKIYYQNNKDKILEKDKEYYQRNKSAINKRNNEYYQRNKDLFKIKAINRKKRVKYISDGTIKLESLNKMYEEQNHKCAYCGCDLEENQKHLDHILPISRGGKHTIKNVHWTCAECNLSKGNKTEEEWLTKEKMKPTDIWTNHPNPKFKPACKNGDPCHTPAPRGSSTGTQGLKNAIERARIPQELCNHIVKICEE